MSDDGWKEKKTKRGLNEANHMVINTQLQSVIHFKKKMRFIPFSCMQICAHKYLVVTSRYYIHFMVSGFNDKLLLQLNLVLCSIICCFGNRTSVSIYMNIFFFLFVAVIYTIALNNLGKTN